MRFKKHVSFILILAVFIQILGILSLTANAATSNYYQLINYNGDSFTDTVGGKRQIIIGSASGLSFASTDECAGSDGMAYIISGTAGASAGPGVMYINSKFSNAVSNFKYYKYLSFTYDVNFANNGNGFYFRFKQYASNGTADSKAYNIYVGTPNMTAVSDPANPNYSNYSLPCNEWHRISISIGADGKNNTLELYIDGINVDTVQLTSGAYGLYTAPDGWISAAVSKNSEFKAYIDNISLYAGSERYIGSRLSNQKTVNVSFDSSSISGTVPENALGYAYEGGHLWNEDSGGETYSSVGVKIKDDYINYLADENTALPFSSIRIGGYTSNYTLWKRDIEHQPYSYPYPKAQKPNELTYYPPVVRLSDFERVRLALAYNPDTKIIICPNIWSAEPNSDNMKNENGVKPFDDGTVYPVKIMRNLDEYTKNANYQIDNDIYQNALDNLLDEIRFFTCSVDDPNAVCEKCGVNWAQKRADLGYIYPIDIYCWELGNEFYLRECTADAYVTLAQKFLTDVRKVFPNLKFAAHCTTSSNWMTPVVSKLGNSVDFISTHNYYTYLNGEASAVSGDSYIQQAMEATGNKNLRLMITEGGLNNFNSTNVEPEFRSLGMSTSFVKFFNDLVKLKRLETFTYFGSTGQLTYNTGMEGGLSSFNSVALYDNNGQYAYALRKPSTSSPNSGFLYIFPKKKYIESSGKNVGEETSFTFKFKYKTDKTPSGETLSVGASWADGKSYSTMTSIKTVSDKTLNNTWREFSYTFDTSIPEDKAFLRFAIYGSDSTYQNTIYLKDVELIPNGKSNIAPKIGCDDHIYNEYHDTAIAEVLRYYLDNCKGDIVMTSSLDSENAKYISPLILKTDNGVRMFLSNLSSSYDYHINFSDRTAKKYVITKRFMQTGKNQYVTRDKKSDEIVTTVESYLSDAECSSILLEHNSVLIIDLTDKALCGECFTDSVVFKDGICTIKGECDENCSIICAFYDNFGKLVKMSKTDVLANDYDINVNCPGDYKTLKLFKWGMEDIKPIAKREILEY